MYQDTWENFHVHEQCNNCVYYMTNSVRGQDEPNRALWLATRAGKMELSCPLRITPLVLQDQRLFCGVLSHTCIINPLLTELVLSRWLDIGLVPFLRVYGPRLRPYPAILTSRLVNNPYNKLVIIIVFLWLIWFCGGLVVFIVFWVLNKQ